MPSLTVHLVNSSTTTPYSAAVAHPFLEAAAKGTLDPALLSLWLCQDRIYAMHAYPRFIGALIAKIDFNSAHGISSSEERLNQRILRMLAFALDCVMKEADFFKSTAQKCNLPLDCWRERKATRDYTAEMCRAATGMRIEEGLVFLWAMEKVGVSLAHMTTLFNVFVGVSGCVVRCPKKISGRHKHDCIEAMRRSFCRKLEFASICQVCQ